LKLRKWCSKPRVGAEMKRLILALFFTIMMVSSVNAQSTLALEEKCAEGARKWFRDHSSEVIHGYSSHYNKKLDKCLIRVDYFFSKTELQLVQLHDAFDWRLIGSCLQRKDGTLVGCYVGTKMCGSRLEFEALIKPYMED